MKKLLIALFSLTLVLSVYAGTKGVYNQAVNGTVTLTHTEASTVFVKNNSTSVVYVAFGGHAVASTNDPVTYYANRMPIDAGDFYTTAGKFSIISVYCATNGLVNVGFEGAE